MAQVRKSLPFSGKLPRTRSTHATPCTRAPQIHRADSAFPSAEFALFKRSCKAEQLSRREIAAGTRVALPELQTNGHFTTYVGSTNGWQADSGTFYEYRPDGTLLKSWAIPCPTTRTSTSSCSPMTEAAHTFSPTRSVRWISARTGALKERAHLEVGPMFPALNR
jgi:hypothetical protein